MLSMMNASLGSSLCARSLAVGDRALAVERERVTSGFFRDLRKVKIDAAVVVFVVIRRFQVLEQFFGALPVLHLEGERCDREFVVTIALVRCPEALEDRAGFAVTLLLDVELRQRSRRGL